METGKTRITGKAMRRQLARVQRLSKHNSMGTHWFASLFQLPSQAAITIKHELI